MSNIQSNIQQISSAVGAVTAIFLINVTQANAEIPKDSDKPTLKGTLSDNDMSTRSKSFIVWQPKSEASSAIVSLPQLSQINMQNPTQFLTASNWNFLPLPQKLAQLAPISPQDRSEDESKLPLILNIEKTFSNKADPLLLPTTPDGVTIDVQQPVTLENAISIALNNNQEIEISRLGINRSLEQLREAKAALYPTLSSSSGLENRLAAGVGGAGGAGAASGSSQLASAAEATSINGSATNTFNNSLSLSYDVYDGGSRGASIDSAKQQVRLDQLVLQQTIEETSLQVATDYYGLQSAEAQVQIEQAAVDDATQTMKDADVLERGGVGTEFEVLQAKVALAQAKQTLKLEQANLDTAQRQLSNTLNIGQKVELQTKGEIKPAGKWKPSLAESIVMAYKNRAELKQFKVQKEINAKQRKIALAENRPQVSLLASYDLQDQLDDNSDLADGYSVGASVTWAFFDGGAARARARQSATEIEIDNAEFANQRDQVRFEVEDAYYSLNANQENIDTAKQAVELSQESLRLARLRFQAGAGTQTDVIAAQADLTTARGNLLSAVVEYNLSFAQLKRAITNLPNSDVAKLTP